jgi:hypothetical protein
MLYYLASMKTLPILLLYGTLIAGCAGEKSQVPVSSKNAQPEAHNSIEHSFTSVSDLNDAYFSLTHDLKFEYYKLLFDSIRNTNFSGTYTIKQDTIFLKFDDEEGKKLLGERVLMDTLLENILFIDAAPESKYMHLFN